MKYYHVTTKSNADLIMIEGLIQQIGPRAQLLVEQIPCIYLFDSVEMASEAVCNRLGDYFNEEETLILLSVELDKTKTTKVAFEYQYFEPIPKTNITIENNNF